MCENKILLLVAAILLTASGFCKYQVNSENKLTHHCEFKSERPCDKEERKYCLNGGECYYLISESSMGCKCTWFL